MKFTRLSNINTLFLKCLSILVIMNIIMYIFLDNDTIS